MRNRLEEYYAIILSSTFNEDEISIFDFLKHVSHICQNVVNQYKVLPVLVFEQIENSKRFSIQRKIDEEKLEVPPLLLINNEGKGFASCLNFGIKNTNSKFIFRLDTDDRTNSKRIIDQLDVMKNNCDDLSCGFMEDQKNNLLKYPSDISEMALMTALGTNPIAHPSVCIRKESLLFLYDESLERCEDFDLWLRLFLSKSLKLSVLKNAITKYDTSRSFEKDKENALAQIRIRLHYIKKIFLIFIILLIGLVPNILRYILKQNFLLFLRRKL